MPKVGEAYRVYYSASNGAAGLHGIVYYIHKPNGARIGPYAMSELDPVRAPGIYYDDFLDGDVEGDYLVSVGFPSHETGQYEWTRKSVRFERREWTDAEKTRLLADVGFLRDVEGGKWEMQQPNVLVFYKADNVTEVARFRCFNQAGLPAMEGITRCERVT